MYTIMYKQACVIKIGNSDFWVNEMEWNGQV